MVAFDSASGEYLYNTGAIENPTRPLPTLFLTGSCTTDRSPLALGAPCTPRNHAGG
jgi:hypothetical protein